MRRIFAGAILLLAAFFAFSALFTGSPERRALDKTRRDLKRQGFKIDLSQDDQFLTLQREWQQFDVLKDVPETISFYGAAEAGDCEQERKHYRTPGVPLKEWYASPRESWRLFARIAEVRTTFIRDSLQYERRVLATNCQHGLLTRGAIDRSTWSDMYALSGISDDSLFEVSFAWRSPHGGFVTIFLEPKEGLLGRAVEAEAWKRVIITALAVERFRLRHGSYPTELTRLVPEFLATAPIDFIDGKPLRYSTTPDGHFLLYSIGLDRVDDGGALAHVDEGLHSRFDPQNNRATGDLVWPLPATSAEVDAYFAGQTENKAIR